MAIASGEWPYELGSGESPCARLLRRYPMAAEVSERAGVRSLSTAGGSLSTQLILRPSKQGIERLERKRFADPPAAQRAVRLGAAGTFDIPSMAGLPVTEAVRSQGDYLERRASLSWEDLRLAVADRTRMRSALSYDEAVRAQAKEVSIEDLGAFRAVVGLRLRALQGIGGAERRAAAQELRALLKRGRQRHPGDVGLARRLFTLLMGELAEPHAARAVAESVLAQAPDDPRYWELLRRAALARYDSPGLAQALHTAHGLSPFQAKRMASELSRRVSSGEAYERAEWAWLTSRELDRRAAEAPLSA
ncbi:MAG: hypothetical protein MO852_17585, partial [Candidatus Devosia euplotis]|nr:hypothetical protein [Candidatus Devosia euplotis]